MTRITLGAIGVLTLLLISSGWIIKGLYEDVGKLEQVNSQLKQSLVDEVAENAALMAELDRRDDAVTRAMRARQAADRAAQAAQDTLQEALSDDACANTNHPDAITDSLRSLSSHPDKDSVPIPANGSD